MASVRGAGQKLGVVRDLLRYLWKRKIWWMLPMIVVLVGIGALIAISLTTPVAPFVYTLF